MGQRAGTRSPKSSVGERGPRLVALVGRQAHVALVRLADGRVVSASDGVPQLLGLPQKAIIGRRVSELLYRGDTESALPLMRLGYIEFYRAHRTTLKAGSPNLPICAWVHAVELRGERYALAAFAKDDQVSPELERVVGVELVLGTLDRDWRMTALSGNVTKALGVSQKALLGQTLHVLDRPQLHALGSLVRADLAAHEAVSLGLRVLAPPELARRSVRAVVLMGAADPQPRERYVILARGPDAANPEQATLANKLENHLWRIAAEVEASGILDRLGYVPVRIGVPPTSGLSPRQWEVLRRLLQGQRVATIAAELFISQSTVRNHLSAIFERFGVNSQAELLDHFSENKRSV